MCVDVERGPETACGRGAPGQLGDARRGPGGRGGRQRATGDGVHHLAVGGRVAPGHLQIEARGHRSHPVDHRTPVAHYDTVEAPLVTQHAGEQPVALRCPLTVDPVVGRHHRPRPGLRDDPVERPQVDLPQRS